MRESRLGSEKRKENICMIAHRINWILLDPKSIFIVISSIPSTLYSLVVMSPKCKCKRGARATRQSGDRDFSIGRALLDLSPSSSLLLSLLTPFSALDFRSPIIHSFEIPRPETRAIALRCRLQQIPKPPLFMPSLSPPEHALVPHRP